MSTHPFPKLNGLEEIPKPQQHWKPRGIFLTLFANNCSFLLSKCYWFSGFSFPAVRLSVMNICLVINTVRLYQRCSFCSCLDSPCFSHRFQFSWHSSFIPILFSSYTSYKICYASHNLVLLLFLFHLRNVRFISQSRFPNFFPCLFVTFALFLHRCLLVIWKCDRLFFSRIWFPYFCYVFVDFSEVLLSLSLPF